MEWDTFIDGLMSRLTCAIVHWAGAKYLPSGVVEGRDHWRLYKGNGSCECVDGLYLCVWHTPWPALPATAAFFPRCCLFSFLLWEFQLSLLCWQWQETVGEAPSGVGEPSPWHNSQTVSLLPVARVQGR